MRTGRIVVLIIIFAAWIVASQSLYTVNEAEQVIITMFGKPTGDAVLKAGLHIKKPFVEKVNRFDKRWLEWDGDANQIPTRDKKYIWVDNYARWRISDPLLFFQTVRDERGAQTRLDDIIDGETRNAVASHNLIEIVRTSNRTLTLDDLTSDILDSSALEKVNMGREKLVNSILEKASVVAKDYGIEIVDVRIKRINYSEKVQAKVYDRMISERQRIATKYRSEGQGKSAEIRGQKEKELKKITSEAYKTAQEVMGKADAEATKIYARAYRQDPDFYSFIKTLESYKNTLDEKSWLILSTESDFYRYLKKIR